MSATIKTNTAEGGALAHLNFRVRCETLGHGEGVFLIRSDDPHLARVSFFVMTLPRTLSIVKILVFLMPLFR